MNFGSLSTSDLEEIASGAAKRPAQEELARRREAQQRREEQRVEQQRRQQIDRLFRGLSPDDLKLLAAGHRSSSAAGGHTSERGRRWTKLLGQTTHLGLGKREMAERAQEEINRRRQEQQRRRRRERERRDRGLLGAILG